MLVFEGESCAKINSFYGERSILNFIDIHSGSADAATDAAVVDENL